MPQNESNNDFFSYYGKIGRKNYVINMLILLSIVIGLSFIKIETFASFITYQFLFTALVFMINMLRFVAIMAILSVVYRRIVDFSENKPNSFKIIMNRTFVLLFVLPILYDFCIRFFIDIIPPLQHMLDLATVFLLYPLAFIAAIVFAFLKGK